MVTPPQIKCEQDISKEESGFPIVGQGGMGGDPNFMIFLNPPPPPKLMPSHGVPPYLKIKPLIWKMNSPPLKHETPFHEMIPKKAQ